MSQTEQTNPQYTEEELDQMAKEARVILWNQGLLSWKLDVTQQKIYDDFKNLKMKTITFNCSRRLGKTYLLTIMAIEQCLQFPDSIVKFLQPKAKMIRGTLRPIMKKILEDCPQELRPVFMTQDNLYRFPNGSEIQLAGTDNGHYESIRGGDCHLALVDEAGFCDDLNDIIEFILIPTTTLTKGRIILSSTTPTDPAHAFNDILVKAEEKGTLIRKTYKDAIKDSLDTPNARITQQSLDEILASLPGGEKSQAYKTEYNCERVFNSKDSVIGEFAEVEKEAVCEWPRPAFCHKYVSMDIGFSDLTFVIFGYWDYRNAVLVIEDEYVINGPELTSVVLGDAIAGKEDRLWGTRDIGAKNVVKMRISDNNNPILLNDLLKGSHKLFFHATEKHNKDAFVNEMKVMMGAGQIKINPRCKKLIVQLRNATWNKQRNDFKRVEDEDKNVHHYDGVAALMYLVRNIEKSANPFPLGFQYSHLGDRDNVFFRDDLEKTTNKSLEKLNDNLFKSHKTSFKSNKK